MSDEANNNSVIVIYLLERYAQLDPLIAEAKQKARRRRLLLASALLLVGVSVAAFALKASAGPASPKPLTHGLFQRAVAASAGTGCTAGSRPVSGKFPGDANGDGKISDSGSERIPTLIAAVGDHGAAGYVRITDVLCTPAPASPAAALVSQGKPQMIPVYASNGTTVVDTLTLSTRR